MALRFYNRMTKLRLDRYKVDSISNPQASSSASGIYFEFLFRRAHSRSLVDRMYWSGVNLYSFTTCSKDVTVGTTGPIGSGLPQLGFPRRFAIRFQYLFSYNLLLFVPNYGAKLWEKTAIFILRRLAAKGKPRALAVTDSPPPIRHARRRLVDPLLSAKSAVSTCSQRGAATA